jgi:hypothetical protein
MDNRMVVESAYMNDLFKNKTQGSQLIYFLKKFWLTASHAKTKEP